MRTAKRNPECKYCCLGFLLVFKLEVHQLIGAHCTFYKLVQTLYRWNAAPIVADGCAASTSELLNWNY